MECPACDHPNADGARYCAKCGALLPPMDMDGSDPLIGQVVGGRYRIVGLLGEGGMGRVYTGEQQMGTSIRKVAVKTLLKELSQDSQVVARFMRECGTVVELEHPNTIKFYDFGQTDAGELYIAMEFVDGKALADEIEQGGALSFERVDNIMKQICGSLNEAHDKGVVHRDLKPENVILTTRAGEKDFVKVLDFGIAKRSEASDAAKEQKLTQAGMVLGTPPYMSPEQFTGKEIDHRSDIYSLGVMAYEMLTGKLPFEANTPWEWATQHMTVQPFPFEKTSPMAASIPANMKEAIMRALSKNSAERQNTAKDFYRELNAAAVAANVPGVYASPSMVEPAPAGTTALPASDGPPVAGADSGRPGATQIGEPLFPPPGAGPTAPGPGGGPPMAGMPHQAVPTAGGQAVPAPMAAPARSGGGKGLYIGLAAVVAVLLIGGIVFAVSGSGGGDDETDEIIPVPADTSQPGDTAGTDEPGDTGEPSDTGDDTSEAADADAGETSTAAPDDTADPTAKPTTTTTKTATKPAGDPCSEAMNLAAAKKCGAANAKLAQCQGARRTAAGYNVKKHCSTSFGTYGKKKR
jgi:serine/threonine-protein kinase